MKKRLLLAGVSLALLTLFSACQNPSTPSGTVGSLTLSITDHVSRTLVPTLSMTPVSYSVAGTGPGGATFTEDTTGTLTINKLAFGSWSVSVTAKNAAGTSIGSGTGTVVVHSNQSSTLAIAVIPFTGSGTLTLGLNWTAADVETAQVESTLLPTTGDARDLAFAVDGTTGTASFAANDVTTGYHTLTLKLKDNGALVMGAVEVVRIVKDQTTAGSYTFADINKPGGTMVVNITPEMGDPLTVSIAGATTTKPENQSMNLMASVTEVGVNATYVWYVNGEAKGSGASFTFDSTWAQGNYRIDVTAYSADGTRAGSATSSVLVTGAETGVVRNLAAGQGHSLAIKSDGTLWAFGYNTDGDLGDGTTIERHSPVLVATNVGQVSAGDHSLVLKTDGTLWTFGYNLYGELGDGTTTSRSVPVQVLSSVKAVAAGDMHSLALKTDGTLWAFGFNAYGQLGDGTTNDRHTPVQILTGVVAIAAGTFHSLVLKADGTLFSFGYNQFGQLGDGTTLNRLTPVQVLSGVSKMAAGYGHSFAIKTDGTLWAFGRNTQGQLSDGTTIDRPTPLLVSSGVSDVSAGFGHTLILKNDGSLYSSGMNSAGQLGDGTTANRSSPALVLSGVVSIAAGNNQSLVMKGGMLWTFGYNRWGQLGDGTTTNRSTPVQVPGWNY